MKKLLIALLTAMIVFGFTACNPSTPSVTVTGEDDLIEKLDAAATTGEKTIIIDGTITLTKDLEVSVDGVTLKGADDDAAITVGANRIVITGSTVSVESLAISGSNNDEIINVAQGADNVRFYKISLTSTGTGRGITIEGDNATIDGSVFTDCRMPFYFDENNAGMTKATVRNNTITGSTKVDLETEAIVTLTGNTFTERVGETDINVLSKTGTGTDQAVAERISTANNGAIVKCGTHTTTAPADAQ